MANICVIYVYNMKVVCCYSSVEGELRGKSTWVYVLCNKKINWLIKKKRKTSSISPLPSLSLISAWHFVKIIVNSNLTECWVCSQDIYLISHYFTSLEEMMTSQSIWSLLKHYSQGSAFLLFAYIHSNGTTLPWRQCVFGWRTDWTCSSISISSKPSSR